MKTLLLLRHAKSSWEDPALADHDRPLNKRGRKAAPRMGRLLTETGLRPDRVLCSSARRAQETLRLVFEAAGIDIPSDTRRDLYHCDVAEFVAALRGVAEPADCVMIVGHNPGLEDFLVHLTNCREGFPTAALAQIELDLTAWSQFGTGSGGRLVQLWRPRELDAE